MIIVEITFNMGRTNTPWLHTVVTGSIVIIVEITSNLGEDEHTVVTYRGYRINSDNSKDNV